MDECVSRTTGNMKNPVQTKFAEVTGNPLRPANLLETEEVGLLVKQSINRNEEALNELVRRFRGMALTVAYDKLRDHHAAEDAVQEALTEALSGLSRLREPEAFPGWLKKIVERKCYRLLRSWGRQDRDQQAAAAEAVQNQKRQGDNGKADPANIFEQRQLRESLTATIAQLSPGQRVAVNLFYMQGYSLSEVSAFLGVSVPALKKRLFDARSRLKQTLPVADFIQVYSHLYEGGAHVLHIVNGDHVAEKLKQGKVKGDILPWRELYTFGPVAPDMRDAEFRNRRASYLEQALGIPNSYYLRQSEEQDTRLRGAGQYEEIVLWFEHDLYDQTMLAYLLAELDRLGLISGPGQIPVNLLCIGAYPGIEVFRGLGQLSPEQLSALSGTWNRVGTEEVELGKKFWNAYTSPDPKKHLQFLEEDLSALPFARAAFEAHLARLPSPRNGLGSIEQCVLGEVNNGVTNPYALFKQVGIRLNDLGLGDLEFWYALSRMCQDQDPQALLNIHGLKTFPDFRHAAPDFRDCRLEITAFGRQVMEGEKSAGQRINNGCWVGGIYTEL